MESIGRNGSTEKKKEKAKELWKIKRLRRTLFRSLAKYLMELNGG